MSDIQHLVSYITHPSDVTSSHWPPGGGGGGGGEYLNNLLPSNPIHTLHVHSNHYSGRSRHDTPSSLQLWGMCDDDELAAEPEAGNAALRSQSA